MGNRVLSLLAMCALAAACGAGRLSGRAPNFTGRASDGREVRLSDYKGKFVVLEWFNKDCPFVKKHYSSGNMQKLQADWTGRGVVWFSVISSAPGKQGYMEAAEVDPHLKEVSAVPTAVILDPEGTIGKLYGAKTTPHMFVIGLEGDILYGGAIDDRPTTEPSDVAGAKNYVDAALKDAMAGKPVMNASTVPYGCSVKYKD